MNDIALPLIGKQTYKKYVTTGEEVGSPTRPLLEDVLASIRWQKDFTLSFAMSQVE